MSVSYEDVERFVRRFADVIAEQKEYLTELDAAIGDADHGINMNRGMQAVVKKLDGLEGDDIGALLKTVGMTLISTVGGAGGPLYGTLFLQLGTSAAGKSEITLADWSAMVAAAVAGVQARGKAEPQDKTMVDALIPARDALAAAVDGRRGLRRRAARRPGRGRGGHEGDDPARREERTSELPWRTERGASGPGRHLVVAADADRRGNVRERLRRGRGNHG